MEVAKELIEAGAEKSATNGDGDTPLLLACFGGQLSVAKMLHEKGEAAAQANGMGCSTLLQSCAMGHLEVAQWLLPLAPSLRGDFEGETLHACAHGHEDVVAWLMQQGASRPRRRPRP